MSTPTPLRQVRALYDDTTIRMYQAYNHAIADAALAAGTFVGPFKRDRMTWIKPSFCWMMYRSSFGRKDAGQARILAIDITRAGFEWALANASLSHGPELDKGKPVRVQWDPERNIKLGRLEHRSIQVGLSGRAVGLYVDEWIQRITDVTSLAHEVDRTRDPSLLPLELPYPVPPDIAGRLGLSQA